MRPLGTKIPDEALGNLFYCSSWGRCSADVKLGVLSILSKLCVLVLSFSAGLTYTNLNPDKREPLRQRPRGDHTVVKTLAGGL